MNAADADAAHAYQGDPWHRRLISDQTVTARIARQASARPSSPAITTPRVGSERTISYAELDLLSRSFASWLCTELGNDREVVGLIPRNDLPSVIAILGAMASRHPLLMLSPDDPPERVRQQAQAVGVSTILRSPDVHTSLPLVEVPRIDALRRVPPTTSAAAPDPEDDAFYLGTSGSTAVSKLVAQSHYAAAVNATAIQRHHAISHGDRILGCLPIHHVNGLHFSVLGTLAAGAHLILAEQFEPFRYGSLVTRYQPRIASVVPSIVESLVAMWRDPDVPGGLDYFLTAAAPLTAASARAFTDAFGVRILQGYGLTETINFSTTLPPGLAHDAYERLVLRAEVPSIGTALFGNEVAVFDQDMRPLPPGQIGELCVRGHNVMSRYVGNEQATAAAFRGGWFHTLDLGYAVEDPALDTAAFVLTGRLKNIAKVGGETVSLDEVDRALKALPYVVDAAAVALPHPLLGESIEAAAVVTGPFDEALLRADLALLLPAAAVPRRIERLDAIPRTMTGKVLRPQLAQQLLGGQS